MNNEDSLRVDREETANVGPGSPSTKGAYRIVSQSGENHVGLLYHAVRVHDGTDVDVCVLPDLSESAQQALKNRISLVHQLQHPVVAQVLEIDDQVKRLSCMLEPMCDRSLNDVVEEPLACDVSRRIDYARQIASAVASGHRLGLVHGAISPDAVKVREDGGLQLDYVRSSERGPLGPTHEERETTIGAASPAGYLAPEISGGDQADIAADIYSLGHLLAWLLGGSAMSLNESMSKMRQDLQEANAGSNVEHQDLIEAVVRSISEACSDGPDERGNSMEIWEALDRLAAGLSIENDRGSAGEAAATTAILPDPNAEDETSDLLDTLLVGPDQPAVVDPVGRGDSPQIGRFRLVRKLGEGGMGAVFKAEDLSDGSDVAIKVLRARALGSAGAVRRFRKEARMLGEIRSPFVTNLLEVNQDGRVHYIVMEYVEGHDLQRILRRQRRLDERVSLSLIADVARGLASAHEQGIVHRDIKPGNILLARRAADGESSDLQLEPESIERVQVKLSDFGLARELDQSESMQMTQEGGFIGTPTYMPPEQFDGKQLSPASDVYSLGITLYEMLCGAPPFAASDITELISKHCNASPPPISKYRADVSEATIQIVQRAIAKEPENRYSDATQLLADIERVLRGEPTTFEAHPKVPVDIPGKVFEEVFQWDLEGEPADLWPFVSNTDRINQAVGVPSVVYDTERNEQGRLRKLGKFRMAGLQISWEEHPFEWIEGQRLGILREFHQGPFAWFLSIVDLQPRMEGGTKLTHTVRILPRGVVGRAVATMEVTLKGKRNLDRVYRRIDQAVTGHLGKSPTLDAFASAVTLPSARIRQLESRLDELARRGVDPGVVDCLSQFLREAPSQELGRIRPAALARNFGLAAEKMIDGCLVAVDIGLLDLHWDILCPTCRISSQVTSTLRDIEEHANCEVCDLDFEVDLAKSVEMVFRASPEIRDADIGTYCIGGPEHSPHVVVQLRLQPDARVELSPVLAESEYMLRSAQLPYSYRLRALPGKGGSCVEIVLSDRIKDSPISHVRAGRTSLTIANDYDREIVVRLERMIPLKDVVTAAQACARPLFRELFPAESPKLGTLIRVSTVTLMAIDLVDADRLYEERGDAEVFASLQWLHRLVSDSANAVSGRVMGSAGTEILIALDTPIGLVRLASELAGEVGRSERGLRVRCSAHRGTVLATSGDATLDYFGRTVHLLRRLVQRAEASELLMTEAVASEPLVSHAIEDLGLDSTFVDLTGLGEIAKRCRRVRLP